ncbi:hypothetical protein N7478_001992 [Penicillium angulare]|uniref:uncharacterized protein n=1 Tax=Penicillium angulare TaxID=116970 RepID=UPI00253F847C|nr:uncharacterized protein N7478_001992 [Penicillium angulare]KAJ5288962.1 hypothetical protein N7478_001992 [Penicillium angulare]
MSFGVSVGDFLSGANLAYKLIRALSESNGSTMEYQEASQCQNYYITPHAIEKFQTSNLDSESLTSGSGSGSTPTNTSSGVSTHSTHAEECALEPKVLPHLRAVHESVPNSKELDETHHHSNVSNPNIDSEALADPPYDAYEPPDEPVSTKYTYHDTSISEPDRNDNHEKMQRKQAERNAIQALTKLGLIKESAQIKREKMKPIKFKDAVGRKFAFPWELCWNWQGMEDLIKQAFLHIEVIGPHVNKGHYDLVGPNGDIILPQVWDDVVEPDWTITMHMWPIPEA